MFLSDRDLQFALYAGQLIINPKPQKIDTTSIDLHLDVVESARVWDAVAFEQQQASAGNPAYLGVGQFVNKTFAQTFTVPVPTVKNQPPDLKVFRDGERIIMRPGGFLLWQTKEEVGTPEVDPRLICFVDGKSTRARTGLVVHMTAPTIHAGWWGQITLELGNLGPLTLALQEGDAVAQVVVAMITSPPTTRKASDGVAIGQRDVTGNSGK